MTLERRQQASQFGQHTQIQWKASDTVVATISEVRWQGQRAPLTGVADEHLPEQPGKPPLVKHGQPLTDQGVERMGND